MKPNEATFAIYRDREEIKTALRSFVKLGFNRSDILTFQAREHGSKDFGQIQKYQFKTGAIVGAIFGSILVGGSFVFFNFATMSSRWFLIIPGIFIGAVVGAAGGMLVGIGIPDTAAKRYGQYLQAGGILLSVQSQNPEQIKQAQSILSATGGQDIHLMNASETWRSAKLERIEVEDVQTENVLDL